MLGCLLVLSSSVPAGLRGEQDEAHLGLILVAEKLLVAFPRKEKGKKKKGIEEICGEPLQPHALALVWTDSFFPCHCKINE